MNERFTLTKENGLWHVSDAASGVTITFEEQRFNDTQKITLQNDTFSSAAEAAMLATHLRVIADWLRKEHYDIAMPSLVLQRERIGASIRNLRIQRGLTQTQLAKMAGITQPNLVRIEGGKFSVGIDLLNRIANALGVTISLA